MKKFLIILACLTLILTACNKETDVNQSVTPGEVEQPTLPVDGNKTVPQNPYANKLPEQDSSMPTPLSLIKPEIVTVDFPTFIPEFVPEINIIPLTSETDTLYPYVLGAAFIDKNNQSVKLPDDVERYYTVKNVLSDTVIVEAFILVNKQNKFAFMDGNGKMLTDFIYDSKNAQATYANEFLSYNGYAKTRKVENGNVYFGLIDLKTGKEVVPNQFEVIDFYENFFYAFDGKIGGLYDYTFNMFFETGTAFFEKNDTILEFLDHDKYLLHNNYLYFHKYITYYTKLRKLDVFYIINGFYGSESETKLTVRHQDGVNIFTTYEYLTDWYDSENKIFYLHDKKGIYAISNNSILTFPYVYDSMFYPFDVKLEGDKLTFYITNGNGNYYDIVLSQDGTLTKTDKIFEAEVNGNVRFYWSEYLIEVVDDASNVVKSYNSLEYNWINSDDFIVVGKGPTNADIYNSHGTLLMENAYAVVQGKILVVYTDPNTCYTITSDGNKSLIPDTTPIELFDPPNEYVCGQ